MKSELFATLALGLILGLTGAPTARDKREASSGCDYDQFWNDDMSKCLSCTICKNQSKTPGCDSCPRECRQGMFWNIDTQRCIPCEICKSQPNTPQCFTCTIKATSPPPRTAQGPDIPDWVWILIAMVIVVVLLAVVVAWVKSKGLEVSEVARRRDLDQ
uniref:uncharacterized protein isoform X2 n=1 Tax=Pristiophorus japonicus TaxID=55135 RepID=UPI00398E625A